MSDTRKVADLTVDDFAATFGFAAKLPYTLGPNEELIANGTVIVTHTPMGDKWWDLKRNPVPNPCAPPAPAPAPPLVTPAILPNGLLSTVTAWGILLMRTQEEKDKYTDLTPEELANFARGQYGLAQFSGPGYLMRAALKAMGLL